MTAATFINVVLCAIVLIGMVGQLAYSIVGHPPARNPRVSPGRSPTSRSFPVLASRH